MATRTAYGVAVVSQVNSPPVKEGDVIRTLRAHQPWIVHYHTAGVAGRHEIDETQEFYYPGIFKAIRDTGFTGYVAHEFIATRDALGSLAQAVAMGKSSP